MKVKLRVGCKLWAQRDHLHFQEKLKAAFPTTGWRLYICTDTHDKAFGLNGSSMGGAALLWGLKYAGGGDGTKLAAADAAGRKWETTEADSQGRNEEETDIKTRVRFPVWALQQKAPGAEHWCSTVADSPLVRPIFTLLCGISGFSLSPPCFLSPLLQVYSWTMQLLQRSWRCLANRRACSFAIVWSSCGNAPSFMNKQAISSIYLTRRIAGDISVLSQISL